VLGLTALADLPEECRIMLEDAKAGAYKAMIHACKEADDKFIPMFDRADLRRITHSDAQHAEFQEKAGRPVWNEWLADMKSKGLSGQEQLDFVLAEAKKATGS